MRDYPPHTDSEAEHIGGGPLWAGCAIILIPWVFVALFVLFALGRYGH